jgi:hypothetical protein
MKIRITSIKFKLKTLCFCFYASKKKNNERKKERKYTKYLKTLFYKLKLETIELEVDLN